MTLDFVPKNVTAGKMLVHTEVAEKEYRETALKFIEAIFQEFAKDSMRFFQPDIHLEDPPYLYTERPFDSVILPALHRLCRGLVLAELPVKRSDHETSGRIDYWCIYEGYSFIIEMKSTECCLGYGPKKYRMIGRWGLMCKQLESSENDARKYIEYTKGVIPIGLHFVTAKGSAAKWDYRGQRMTELCKETMQEYADAVSKPHTVDGQVRVHKPSFVGGWIVPQNNRYPIKGEIHPFVMLLGKINPKIQHEGAPERRKK